MAASCYSGAPVPLGGRRHLAGRATVSTRRSRIGWRKAAVAAVLAGAALLPQTAVYAQTATPRPAPTATRAAGASPATGEPTQDIATIAVVLGALIVGGFT